MNASRFARKITPTGVENVFKVYDKCLYGVSVGGENQNINTLLDGYGWASKYFKRCCILLGDSLYRFTIQITQGVEPDQAGRIAHEAGEKLLNDLLCRFSDVPEVIRCSDIQKLPSFDSYHNTIRSLVATNSRLAESILRDAISFVDRQEKHSRLCIPKQQAIRISTQYLIEEMGIYGLLSKNGWVVDVYYGKELPTLARIINGEIEIADNDLKRRINIELRRR